MDWERGVLILNNVTNEMLLDEIQKITIKANLLTIFTRRSSIIWCDNNINYSANKFEKNQ